MAGSLRQRERNVWEMRVYAGRDPLTDKKRYVSRTFRGSKRNAEIALSQLVADTSREPGQGTTATTLGELIAMHLANAEIEATTLSDYQSIYKSHVEPALATRPLAKLNTADLDRFYRALSKPVADGGKGLSPSRVRHAHALISGSLKQAVRWGWITRNPARDATLPRVHTKRVTPPSSADAARALQAAEAIDAAFAVLLRVAIATGVANSVDSKHPTSTSNNDDSLSVVPSPTSAEHCTSKTPKLTPTAASRSTPQQSQRSSNTSNTSEIERPQPVVNSSTTRSSFRPQSTVQNPYRRNESPTHGPSCAQQSDSTTRDSMTYATSKRPRCSAPEYQCAPSPAASATPNQQ